MLPAVAKYASLRSANYASLRSANYAPYGR